MTSLPSWSILTSSWMSHSGLSLLPLPLLFLCSRSPSRSRFLSLSLALALHSSLVHTVGCLGAVRLIRKMTKHTEYHVPYTVLQRKSVPWSLEHDFPSVYPAILIFHNHRCEPSKFVSSCSILINKCALSCSIHYSGRKEEMRWGYKRSQCSRHMYMVDMAFEYTSSFRLARVPNSQISLKATFTRHRSHPTLRLGSS